MKTVFSNPMAYLDFRRSVTTGYAHIFDDVAQAFLDAVADSLRSRLVRKKKGSRFSRARPGCDWKQVSEDTNEAISYGEDGMKPTSKAAAGRANSACKPVLYAATDDKTAVAEIRPWIGALVSVGSFRVVKELKLANCADVLENLLFRLLLRGSSGNATQDEIDTVVWHYIGQAFAEPVTRDDDPIAYLPTQILAELFKRHGADGVEYKSSVGEGLNIAIFDLDAVKLESSRVVQVSNLSIEIEEGPFY